MTATGIVAFFSALSAASSGAHHSLGGLLAMLTACRSVSLHRMTYLDQLLFEKLGSFSVSELEQSIHVVRLRRRNSLRRRELQNPPSTAGLRLLLVRNHFLERRPLN